MNKGQALNEDVFLSRVELSDGQVKIVDPKTFLASVHFRGTNGRPAAGHWYRCVVDFHRKGSNTSYTVAEYDGATMSMEGSASKELKLDERHPFKPGESFEFQFAFYETSSEVNGRRTHVGNLAQYLTGTVQVPN